MLSMWEVFSIPKTCVHCRCWPSIVCMSSANRLWKTARTGSRSSRLQHQNQSHLKYSWSDVRYVMCVRDVEFCWNVFVVSCNYLISSFFFFFAIYVLRRACFISPSMHLFVAALFCKYFCLTCFYWFSISLEQTFKTTLRCHPNPPQKNKPHTLIMQFSALFLCPVISLRNIRITNDRQLCKNKEDITPEIEDEDEEEGRDEQKRE